MSTLIREMQDGGLWTVALIYALASAVAVGMTWATVAAFDLTTAWVGLTAVFAFMGMPMVIGIAWALLEPRDPDGKGFVVRD